MTAATAPGDGALTGLVQREEVLQISYWYKGEGFGETVTAAALAPFLTSPRSAIDAALEDLVARDLMARDARGFRLTPAGLRGGCSRTRSPSSRPAAMASARRGAATATITRSAPIIDPRRVAAERMSDTSDRPSRDDAPQRLVGLRTNEEWDALLERVDALIAGAERIADPATRQLVQDLLQGIDSLHREALTRLVRLFKDGVLEKVVTDPPIRTLLELYDLAPPSGGAVPDFITGYPPPSFARHRAAPEPAVATNPIPHWVPVLPGLESLPSGSAGVVTADDRNLLVARVGGAVFALDGHCLRDGALMRPHARRHVDALHLRLPASRRLLLRYPAGQPHRRRRRVDVLHGPHRGRWPRARRHRHAVRAAAAGGVIRVAAGTRPEHRTLVAGVGNVLRGDDGFGVRVAQLLMTRPDIPAGVRVIETGIGGMALVQELMDGYDALVLVDACRRGGAPGTLYRLEPAVPSVAAMSVAERRAYFADTHYATPMRALALASCVARLPGVIRIIGCEPGETDAFRVGLSPEVEAVVGRAADMAVTLARQLALRP
jgi:hydrogenase maturation protease